MDKPSKMLLGLEPIRGVAELGVSFFFNGPLRSMCQQGDDHPVLVFPGLGAGDETTVYLRKFLNDIGYKPHAWKLGRNLGPRGGMEAMMETLEKRLREVYLESGNREVSLIGWSLGGIYARELAKRCPEMVRQVMTLGTPFKSSNHGTNAAALYEVLSGDSSHKDPTIIAKLSIPPELPFTSIYSKTDGVVHWECSIEDIGPMSENIEVKGASHLGLIHNTVVLYLVADRLTKTKESWTMFVKK